MFDSLGRFPSVLRIYSNGTRPFFRHKLKGDEFAR